MFCLVSPLSLEPVELCLKLGGQIGDDRLAGAWDAKVELHSQHRGFTRFGNGG